MAGLLFARLRNRVLRTRLRGRNLHPLAHTNLKALDQISRNQNAKSLRYVVLDLETTGLSLTRDRVVSLAAYRIVDGRILLGDVFHSLVSPGRDIPSSAVKIHGIMPSMVASAPLFADVFEQFPVEFLEKHEDSSKKFLNLSGFLKKQLLSLKIPLEQIQIRLLVRRRVSNSTNGATLRSMRIWQPRLPAFMRAAISSPEPQRSFWPWELDVMPPMP